jgi:hypothetical protein
VLNNENKVGESVLSNNSCFFKLAVVARKVSAKKVENRRKA